MITMTTHDALEFIKSIFPELASLLKNGNIDRNSDKSIGIFQGSETRIIGILDIGGLECTTVRMLPVNIHIRWTSNQRECDAKAVEIYNTLLLLQPNSCFNNIKIAYVQLLDSAPSPLGRDEKNICESIIRANFYYYV